VKNEELQKTEMRLSSILLQYKDLMTKFKKDLYQDAFMSYLLDTKTNFSAIESECDLKPEEQQRIVNEYADEFVKDIMQDLGIDESKKMNSAQTKELDNYKMTMALFTIPMIGEQRLNISDSLIDALIERWTQEFPKMKFYKGNYDELKDGFKKKGFCYITTAVCKTLDKSDDCYELTMFRQFRDSFLLQEEDGARIVSEYYELAPEIVNRINQQDNKQDIYEEIWKGHLATCLQNIEDGSNQLCKENYIKMVKNLQKQYIV
jgi:hypothetical protein